MCTLVVLRETVRGHPLVVAANRDEYLARPSSPPTVHPGPLPSISPLDREAGGTWIGINARSVFVALVNRGGALAPGPMRSRGWVVRDALRKASAAQIAEAVGELARPPCSPFALVHADAREAFLTVHGPEGTLSSSLGQGSHVICSRDPNDLTSRKVQRIREEIESVDWEGPPEVWKPALVDLLGRHPDPAQPLENTCVHREGYGTRSAEILARGSAGWRWWHAEGRPCQTEFTEISHLWEQLQQLEARGLDDPATLTEETRP